MSNERYVIQNKSFEDAKFVLYRAARQEDGLPVLLKTFKSSYPTAQALSQLKQEFALLQKITHAGIPRGIALEPAENSLRMVLSAPPGPSLRSLLDKERFSLPEFFALALPLLDTVNAIHGHQVIHKHINPSNIYVDSAERSVQLYGWNLAAELGREASYPHPEEVFEARLAYVSPEQTGRMNRKLDQRTDLYSVGAVCYEMLTGRPPFTAEDPAEIIHSHIAREPIAPHELRKEIPLVLSEIIRKSLAKSAEDRYHSASGFLRDLRECRERYRTQPTVAAFPLGQHDVSGRFNISGKLYGREEELAALSRAYDRARGGKAEVIMVAGYSGMGKSVLVREVRKLIDQNKGFFIQGKFDQIKQNAPLSTLLTAFSDLIRQLLMESEEQIARWRTDILTAVGVNGQILIDAIPEMELLLGPQPPTTRLPTLEANNRFNQVFGAFVRVFAKAAHPLCIFLDDMQWLDSTTRQWIETQLNDRQLKHFILIGAYRNNEVTASHPLMLLLDQLRQKGVPVSKVELRPLPATIIARLIGDTLSQPAADCLDIAEVIHRKTNGNPFFLRQCLLKLYEKSAIHFSTATQSWHYDLDRLDEVQISDNVIELMTELLHRLSEPVLAILKIAACVGSSFGVDLVSEVGGQSSETTEAQLVEAEQLGLIVPIQLRGEKFSRTYAFQHDKIQQAAFSLLRDGEKQRIELAIGRLLVGDAEEVDALENIYEIADHLNAASGLIAEEWERDRLVRVNLAASIRAKNATAYEPALAYVKEAMELVPADALDRPSVLTRELFLQRAESEHLCGHDAVASTYFDRAAAHADSHVDKARVYLRKIHYYNNLGKFAEAYRTGREAARPLGVRLPGKFVPPKLIRDVVRYRLLRGTRKIKDIIGIGDMTDEKLKMAILVMSTVARSAYQIKPELCVAVSAKMVNLCLRHGNTDGGFIGFLAFGPIFHGAILKQRQAGFEFGQLTLALVEKYQSVAYKPETHFVVGYFAMPWGRPVVEMEQYWQIAYDTGLQVGDFFHASCACCGTIQSYFMRGMDFGEIMQAADRYLVFLKNIGHAEGIMTIDSVRQSIKNLRGETHSPTSYSDDDFDEESYAERLARFGSRHFAHYYYINKMRTLYQWGEYDRAYEMVRISDTYLKDSPGMLHTAEHFFYKGLILAALSSRQAGDQDRTWKSDLRKISKQFRQYAKGCADNFLHKSQILEAEVKRLDGKDSAAQDLYYAALESARQYGYRHIQALANQLLARFHRRAGRNRIAGFHLRDAVYDYSSLGANAYADFLADRGNAVTDGKGETVSRNRLAQPLTEDFSPNGSSRTIDLSTVLKSSEAISREIRLRDLLSTLMRIIIENAGAERMVLLLKEADNLVVQAECLAKTDDVQLLAQIPLSAYDDLAKSVVNYVSRTNEPVILDHAAEDDRFGNDAYVRQVGLRSVLCAPLIKQGKTTGVIYLENNLANGVFTKDRIDLIILLSGQMAISIDNALLYDNLEEKVRERTRELNAEKEKSDNLLLNILPADIAKELKTTGAAKAQQFQQVTVLFTDFKNFSQICERLDADELVEEINHFYSAFDRIIEKHRIEKIKTIGDSYMCAGGLTQTNDDNAVATLEAALEIQEFMRQDRERRLADGKRPFALRIGLHTGPVVAGIVGIKKFAYDIWGDTVNIASRMESNGESGKINISESTYELVKDRFACTYRGKIEAKNKGMIDMYYVEGNKVPAN